MALRLLCQSNCCSRTKKLFPTPASVHNGGIITGEAFIVLNGAQCMWCGQMKILWPQQMIHQSGLRNEDCKSGRFKLWLNISNHFPGPRSNEEKGGNQWVSVEEKRKHERGSMEDTRATWSSDSSSRESRPDRPLQVRTTRVKGARRDLVSTLLVRPLGTWSALCWSEQRTWSALCWSEQRTWSALCWSDL